MARALAAAGERPRAHEVVDRMLQRNARDPRALLVKGALLLDEGHRDAALSRVRSAVELDPASVDAQYLLGKLYSARGDVDGAQAAFAAVLKLNPRAAAAQVELANLHLAQNRPEAAVAAAREATSVAPRNIAARLALVRGLLARQDRDGAERELKALLTEYPDAAQVHVQAGALATFRKDLAAARQAFERAMALDPASVDALGGLIALDLAAGNFANATARVEARLTTDQKPALLLLAARTYAAAKDLARAEGFLKKAVEKEPTLLPAYGMLGRLYVSQRRLADAKREFSSLASRQTRPVGALTMIGIIHQLEGNLPKAEEYFAKALAVDDKAAVAANNLAWLYAERGEKLDIALQLAQTAVAGMPDSPEVADTLGWVYYKKAMPDLAVQPLTRAAESDPKNPTHHYHLGLALAKAGDVNRARQCLRRALELKPDFEGSADAKATLTALASR
jgi:tetratricopeptide (TPR) repeat protein